MKDIKMEKNKKVTFAKFEDLFTARDEIVKHASKNPPVYQYSANFLAETLHPGLFSVRISKIVEETNDIKSFWFVREDQEDFPPFEAGSYVNLQVEWDGRIYQRAYSISSSPSSLKEYRLTIKNSGSVSKHLFLDSKEGDLFFMGGPYGSFHFQALRDSKDLIFLVGGSYLSTCYPMIVDCLEHRKVNSISLLYGVKTVSDILWKQELEKLSKKYPSFTVTYLLSEEKRENYPSGVINEEWILKQQPQGKTFFLAGPIAMYEALNPILKNLDIPNRMIRHEIYATKPDHLGTLQHQLTVRQKDKEVTIPCYENETLFHSMEKNRVLLNVQCTVGVCGYCRSKLVSGEVRTNLDGVRKADVSYHFIHPCVTYPLSDIVLEIY